MILAALAAVIAPALAHAEDIVLPYTCQMQGGRPSLIPSAPHPHRIVGNREDRRVTACSPADPGRCRAWTAYRFDMLCSGVEVPWTAVVANSPPARGGAAWIENGRFHLSMPPAWALPAQNPCSRLIDDRDPGLERYCASQPPPSQPSFAEMPAGFAPMFGLNGSFVPGNSPGEPAATAYNTPRPQSMPGSAALPPAVTPSGNLNWRASPTAPPQTPPPQPDATASATAPSQPAWRKKPAAQTAARPEPALKPAIPAGREDGYPAAPAETPVLPPPTRAAEHQSPVPLEPQKPFQKSEPARIEAGKVESGKLEPAKIGSGKIETARLDPPKPEPLKPPAPATTAAPAAPALTPAPAAAPAAQTAPPPAVSAGPPVVPLPPAQSAAEPAASTQLASNRATREPYSSRPVKIASPDEDLRTGLMIAGSVALTLTLAGAAFMWRRRATPGAGELEPAPRAYRDRPFDAPSLGGPHHGHDGGFHDGIRLPGFDGPTSPATTGAPATAAPPFEDPFDRPLPSLDGLQSAPAPASSGRTRSGHTLTMEPLDGVRTHLDADIEDEYAPILAHDPELPFEAVEPPMPATPGGQALTLTPPQSAPPALAASPGAAAWATDMMPQSRDDALHILGMGVTARASLPAMKKIVDGLRLIWHPDRATDDADRTIRELRIRQINTAWDLINDNHPDHDPAI